MGHGYLGDGYGKDGNRDPDDGRDEIRGGNWRDPSRGEWAERSRQSREWRPQSGAWAERGQDRYFMFEGSRGGQDERNRDWDREPQEEDRQRGGFLSRTADQARDWFREDEHDDRQTGNRADSGDWSGRPRGQDPRFSSHQDDHYLRWRQQQMDALDRDYQDYCRERQQQFQQDFTSWRSNRQPRGQQGAQQASGQESPELELTAQHALAGTAGTSTDPANAPQSTIDPDSAATLGTNNSENSGTGRGGRR